MQARARSRVDSESGFSLVEVVIAVGILAILSTASLSIYLQSMNSASGQQRREIAITIANQTLENVNAWSTGVDPASGVSFLYTGRTHTKVQQYWDSNADVAGVAQTYPVWDTRSPAVDEGLPIVTTAPVVRNGTEFTVETLIGTCYQQKTGGDCTRISGWSGYPLAISNANNAIYTALTRVIVIVRWSAGGSCDSGACMYQAATLIDLSSDLEWNTP
jgi:prepilin-type N-terminal cleavage/methylation domain-containing protein